MRALIPILLFSSSLSLFASTDLMLFPMHFEPRTPGGGAITAQVNLFNAGPEAARNTVVEFDFPATVSFPRAWGTGATCDNDSRPLRCSFGDLAPNSPNDGRVQLQIQAPRATGNVTITVRAITSTEDSNSSNNVATFTSSVVEATNFAPSISFPTRRYDPGSIVEAETSLTNYLESNAANVRIEYAVENGTIEAIDAPSLWSCSIGTTTAVCTAPALDPDCRCSRTIRVAVRTNSDRRGGKTQLSMSATSSLPDFYQTEVERTAPVELYRIVGVNNTSDSGSGSLRDAITTVNNECNAACKIAFEIPVASGERWKTIRPDTPLPPITANRVFIDGTSQTRFAGDTNPLGPEIVIDGSRTTNGHGLEMWSPCESSVEGLVIGNFRDHGILHTVWGQCQDGSMLDSRRIAGNYLGTDPTGTEAWPNLRGLVNDQVAVEISRNLISGNRRSGIWMNGGYARILFNTIGTARDGSTPLPNGASGIYVSPRTQYVDVLNNRIAFNAQMGVALERGAKLADIRQNSMTRNGGLGIDVGLDDRNPALPDDKGAQSNAPVLLSARYDSAAHMTRLVVSLKTANLGPYGNTAQIDVYANTSADDDGEQWIWSQFAAKTNGDAFELSIPGDHRGKWLNATSTRVHFIAVAPPDREKQAQSVAGGDSLTSELSNSVRVE